MIGGVSNVVIQGT
uniref:Uncharacterized protein n=1 Tax=Arundo donax TaxID=35708 RepID=A0A0A9B421_ARUDO